MRILGIETSCDDTCVSILEVKRKKSNLKKKEEVLPEFEILSNIISSQTKIHAKYGGVYPFLAKRAHQKNLPLVFKEAMQKAKNPKIDLVAVTVGPGLEPCLWTGVNFAKSLAGKIKKPLVPVNHIEAHILANFLGENSKFEIRNSKFRFPAVCLIVSGGHTQLILMRNIGDYKILGETRDDAAGECFDKTARILGLEYPGGPAIAREAAKFPIFPPDFATTKSLRAGNFQFPIKLPRPMIHHKNYDFSFSGLKTAVLYHYRSQPKKVQRSKEYIQAMSYEIQQAIIDVLIKKTMKAAKDFRAKSIILGGGVVANKELRKQFKEIIEKEMPNTKYLVPDIKHCTDNAAMTAVSGFFNWQKDNGKKLSDIEPDANLRIK